MTSLPRCTLPPCSPEALAQLSFQPFQKDDNWTAAAGARLAQTGTFCRLPFVQSLRCDLSRTAFTAAGLTVGVRCQVS